MVTTLAVMLSAGFLLGEDSRWSALFEGVAAAVLIGLLAYSPKLGVHYFLNWYPVRFFGRISYSYYLYHGTMLLIFFPAVTWFMTPSGTREKPFLASLAVTVAVTVTTIPLAWLSHKFIERPMMQLGRKL
jgi:peptidoglycan/LPS O-acetylase OafA/YrhL